MMTWLRHALRPSGPQWWGRARVRNAGYAGLLSLGTRYVRNVEHGSTGEIERCDSESLIEHECAVRIVRSVSERYVMRTDPSSTASLADLVSSAVRAINGTPCSLNGWLVRRRELRRSARLAHAVANGAHSTEEEWMNAVEAAAQRLYCVVRDATTSLDVQVRVPICHVDNECAGQGWTSDFHDIIKHAAQCGRWCSTDTMTSAWGSIRDDAAFAQLVSGRRVVTNDGRVATLSFLPLQSPLNVQGSLRMRPVANSEDNGDLMRHIEEKMVDEQWTHGSPAEQLHTVAKLVLKCMELECAAITPLNVFAGEASMDVARDHAAPTLSFVPAAPSYNMTASRAMSGLTGGSTVRQGSTKDDNCLTIFTYMSGFDDGVDVLLKRFNGTSASNVVSEGSMSNEVGLKNRPLALRVNGELGGMIRTRHNVQRVMRDVLEMKHDFVQVDTPYLVAQTPEGAKEFLVPSRHVGQDGKPLAYALAQSPQQHKQMLMVGGVPRYYQFARCFRDEDAELIDKPSSRNWIWKQHL